MTGRELIAELLKHDDIDKKIKLYSLVKSDLIDTYIEEFEFIGDITKVDDTENVIYIEGEYL